MKDGTYWYTDMNQRAMELMVFRLTVKGGRARWEHQESDFQFEGSWPALHQGYSYTNYWDAWAEVCRWKQKQKKEPQP